MPGKPIADRVLQHQFSIVKWLGYTILDFRLKIKELAMTHDYRGWDRGATVGFLFETTNVK